MSKKYQVWDCRVYVPEHAQLPAGFDWPPRSAAVDAIKSAGIEVVGCFSGWGSKPDPGEVAVINNDEEAEVQAALAKGDELERLQAENAALVEALRTKDSCARQCEGAAYREEAKRLRAENAALLDKRSNSVLMQQYKQLLFAVAKKHPNETRHQTALRYIRQAENQCNDLKARTESAEGGGSD